MRKRPPLQRPALKRDMSSFDSESDEGEDDMSTVLEAKAASQTR